MVCEHPRLLPRRLQPERQPFRLVDNAVAPRTRTLEHDQSTLFPGSCRSRNQNGAEGSTEARTAGLTGYPPTVRSSVSVRSASRYPQVETASSMLMPSTPLAYPQVISRTFASFRVVKYGVSAGQRHSRAGFDSRQLHREGQGQGQEFCPRPVHFTATDAVRRFSRQSDARSSPRPLATARRCAGRILASSRPREAGSI